MKAKFPAGLTMAAIALAVSMPAFALQPEASSVPAAAVAAAPQAGPLARPADEAAPMADPRFAPYCLKDTGSVIVAMQNRRAERIARANGTTPKLRCTATGIALKVNADGVPVPDQPGLRNR